MTPRTLLALGAAVLAFSAGALAFDGTTGLGADVAVAAETSHDAAPVHVTKAELRRVDSIELDAEALVLRNGDDTVVKSSMRDSGLTVSVLNRLLGTPSRTQTAEGDGGACFPASTTYTWGGALRVAALRSDARAGNAVEVRILRDSVRSRSGARIELTGPDGVQVGDDLDEQIADAPRSHRVSYGSDDSRAWQLLLQQGWDEAPATDDDAQDATDTGTNGVSALTNETTVTVIGSPMPVHARRSC
ncbi:hypothetical protein ACTHQN_07980 [Curtobacterium flaccumfaciens]|uniref:hypothetical protein n=1 Tax=Curtobacterium flaccumfaciens TaxID=2035 RepID=UPI003F81997A